MVKVTISAVNQNALSKTLVLRLSAIFPVTIKNTCCKFPDIKKTKALLFRRAFGKVNATID
jgi:hypothetical protein